MRGIYSKSSTTGSHSVSFTSNLEAKLQCIPIDPGQLPDFNAYLGDATVGMPAGFGLNGFENRGGDAKLMHGKRPKSSEPQRKITLCKAKPREKIRRDVHYRL